MNIFKYIFILILIPAFFSCEEDITNPDFPSDAIPAIHVDWQAQQALNYGDTIKISPQISPADGATYEWTLNDEIISTERNLVYKVEQEGELTLKFKVTRNGIENIRTSTLVVIIPFVPKEYNKKMIGFITPNGASSDIQWSEITHLIVSSAQVKDAGASVDTTFANAGFDIKTLITTAHNYGVYVLLDVTGTISAYRNAAGIWGDLAFYSTAIDEAKSKKLIDDVLLFVKNNGFDGINLYLNNTSLGGSFEDPEAVTAFVNRFVEASPEEGPNGDFLFTASVPTGWTTGALSMLATIDRFDWYHAMAMGASDLTPTHHAGNWGFGNLATQWLGFGVPADKLVMVFPAFGVHYNFPDGVEIGWGNVDNYITWPSYREILIMDPNAETKGMISKDDGVFYDGHAEVAAKAQYVIDNELAGLAIWSIESDSKVAGKSLTTKANTALGN